MDDIKALQRPTDVPDYGLLNDLLWSDPSDTAVEWEDNERGVSYCFGKAIINDFLVRYDMDLICRAHMVVEDGYEFWNDRTLVTVFSAPNYCGGALLCFSFALLMPQLVCLSSCRRIRQLWGVHEVSLQSRSVSVLTDTLRSISYQRVRGSAMCIRIAETP